MTIERAFTGDTNKVLCFRRNTSRGQRQWTENTPCHCGLHSEGLTQQAQVAPIHSFLEVWLSSLSPWNTAQRFDAWGLWSGYISIWPLGGAGDWASEVSLMGIARPYEWPSTTLGTVAWQQSACVVTDCYGKSMFLCDCAAKGGRERVAGHPPAPLGTFAFHRFWCVFLCCNRLLKRVQQLS